ncbi:alpha-amylase [Streptomyces filamentosus]|uniref:Alpha-amylase inhibitor n=1 Tax=Streptomyces filamentosus TaxID=67294 RepID=A0ABY4UNZ1_STRFL|nr:MULTISPECIES: alpha-amylase [Streptomyces]USC45362.1 alpha-amylase [Streptomyces filamentosus]
MTSRPRRMPRPTALASATAAGLLLALAAAPSASASDAPAPECVVYHQGWRYTDVVNGCAIGVAVTVEYTNGQEAPCRILGPGERATFAGYGTNGNYVTALRVCTPPPA